MREDSEIVISGIGMVTPLGVNAPASISAWASGVTAGRARLSELAGTALEAAEVAVLPPVNAAARLPNRRLLKYMSEAAVLGCLAAHEAVEAARVATRFAPDRVGLFAAVGLAAAALEDTLPLVTAALDEEGRFCPRRLGERGLAATSPLLSFRLLANMPACLVSIVEGIRGPSYVFTPWEGQTGAALVEAWRAVASGEVEAAVVGASDTAASPSGLLLAHQRGLLGEGEVPASGSGYLVFERAGTARRDGVTAHARVVAMSLSRTESGPADPLATRLGRSFAAAPAIALALAAGRQLPDSTAVCGADGHEFRFAVEARS